MSFESMGTAIDSEKTYEQPAVLAVMRFGDLGLGSPNGIPTSLGDTPIDELEAGAEQDARELVEPTDLSCPACIDGRCTLYNADSSEAQLRLRRVGGSASNLGVAMNAESSVMDTLDLDTPLLEQARVIDSVMGYRAAHQGGCGGSNGDIADHKAINEQPHIMNAVLAFAKISAVREYLELQNVSDEAIERAGARIVANAGKTAMYFEQMGWNGQAYVDDVTATNPGNVEVLEVDEADQVYHGHKEKKLVIVLGDKTSNKDDEFVWNLKATIEAAKALAGQRGEEGYLQAVLADCAKHFAVGSRLAHTKTPVEIIAA